MQILIPPWRTQFESFLARAKHHLRVAVPYYGEEAIRTLYQHCKKGMSKHFLLALSESDVKVRSQSLAAIDIIRDDPLASVKFITNLHAKVLIADGNAAIITSSNLTNGGLDRNVEMGVYFEEPQLVKKTIRCFDDLWSKAGFVDSQTLEDLKALQFDAKSPNSGKVYGKKITFAKPCKPAAPGRRPALGWILIHTRAKYGGKGQPENPIEELRGYYQSGKPWHWLRGKPLREGGPYKLLFSWNGKVFGEGTAAVTRDIKLPGRGEYNFAFVLQDYTERRQVDLRELPLTQGQHKSHRDLIRLNEDILKKYAALVA